MRSPRRVWLRTRKTFLPWGVPVDTLQMASEEMGSESKDCRKWTAPVNQGGEKESEWGRRGRKKEQECGQEGNMDKSTRDWWEWLVPHRSQAVEVSLSRGSTPTTLLCPQGKQVHPPGKFTPAIHPLPQGKDVYPSRGVHPCQPSPAPGEGGPRSSNKVKDHFSEVSLAVSRPMRIDRSTNHWAKMKVLCQEPLQGLRVKRLVMVALGKDWLLTSSYEVSKELELRIPLDFVVHAFIASTWDRQEEFCEFKACLVYIGSSGPASVSHIYLCRYRNIDR